VNTEVPDIQSRDDEDDKKVEAAIKQIEAIEGNLVIYTDGSATAGTSKGGAGVVITEGDPRSPTEIDTIQVKGAARTSSYEEEVEALSAACDWISANNAPGGKILICTDSLSLCQALEAMNEGIDSILKKISECDADITVQWVPAHTGIPGNEAADAAAKKATTLDGPGRPVSYSSLCAIAKQSIKDKPPTDKGDKWIAKVYSAYNQTKEAAQVKTREDQVHLSRIRSGNHPSMGYYQNKLDSSNDITCPRCKEAEDTVEHWLKECPGVSHLKMNIFGRTKLDESTLTEEPGKSLALARASILKNGALGALKPKKH
jgi:ribonuclease HI